MTTLARGTIVVLDGLSNPSDADDDEEVKPEEQEEVPENEPVATTAYPEDSEAALKEETSEPPPAAAAVEEDSAWKKLRQSISKVPGRWPRTFSLAFGVVVPVLLLLCISLFFGYFLAHLESEDEIASNNAIVAERAKYARVSQFLGNVSSQVPRICLSVVVRNDTRDEDFDLVAEIDNELFDIYTREDAKRFNASHYSEDIRGIDRDEVQDLFSFMRECGGTVWRQTEQFTGEYATANDLGSPSFHWIRCMPNGNASSSHFNQLFGSYVKSPLRNLTQLRPDLQEAIFVEAWTYHQRELEAQFLAELGEELAKNNITNTEALIAARLEAYERSLAEADGSGQCQANSEAGAWFWFTVMTTIVRIFVLKTTMRRASPDLSSPC